MSLKHWIILGSVAVLLSGCSSVRERFFGTQADRTLPYRASLTKGDDRRNFTVSVRAGAVPIASVRESVRFPATRYCLETYGGSDARWVLDPATGDWAFTRNGQDMIFQGRCVAR